MGLVGVIHAKIASMKLKNIEAFLTVVEHGSFAAAARATGGEASVLSRRVSSLESTLGVTLLQRTTRSLSLTEAGRELSDRASPAVAMLHDAAEELRAADAALSGRIRMAVPGAIGRRLVAPVLFRFLAAHPEVSIDLRISDKRIDLAGEGIDIAVRAGRPQQLHFAMTVLGHSPQVFVASEAYCAQHGMPDRLSALGAHQRVLRWSHGQIMDIEDRDAIPPVLICDDVETVASAVLAGVGVGFLPAWMAMGYPELRVLPIPMPGRPAPIVAVLPGGRRPPRRIRVLLSFLSDAFGADARFSVS
jgi:DNA-binding transcriptional LysR family regulator